MDFTTVDPDLALFINSQAENSVFDTFHKYFLVKMSFNVQKN